MTSGEAFSETVAAIQTLWPPGLFWPVHHDTCLSPLPEERALYLQVTNFYPHKESHLMHKIITNNRFLI